MTEDRRLDRAEIRHIDRLNALLVLGWRQKVQSRARVRIAIEDALDAAFATRAIEEILQAKCSTLLEHACEAHQGDGSSVYSEAA